MIKGKQCKEAKKWLIEKLPELIKLQFPQNWTRPVSQFLNSQNLTLHVLNPFDPLMQNIEERFRATMPASQVVRVEVIQNINLWRRYQVETEQLTQKLGRAP